MALHTLSLSKQVKHWRLLIVDDDSSNRQLLRNILEDNYDISFAKNGFQAIELAEKIEPDLILLDVIMPEMDGYETCVKLKSSPITTKIPIIFISAKNQVEDEERGFNVGAVDYITKPVSPAIVRSRVATHLALYNQQKSFECQLQERTKDLNELNKKLALALSESETANRLKQEFLAIMGHELRTPLNGISGSLELLQVRSFDEEAEELLDIAAMSTVHLNRLLNNILCFIELQAGDLLLNPKRVELEDLLKHCIGAIAEENNRVRIDVELNNIGGVSANLDAERVCTVISHLIDNALKFSEDGNVTVCASVLIINGIEFIQIKVKDTGVGLSKEQRQIVWDIFRQGDGTFSRKTQGIGIGLPLVKGLLELMGGNITLHSDLGKGSEFTVTIPLERAKGEKAEKKSVEALKVSPASSTILVVEDNLINMKVTQKMLKKLGYDSLPAFNGKEALEIMNTSPSVSLILMDCQMPIMDGYEATRQIRTLPMAGNIPVVALTSNISDTDAQNCFSAGMNDHLGKPVSLKNLKMTLDKWL